MQFLLRIKFIPNCTILNLVNLNDFNDLFIKVRQRGWGYVFSKLNLWGPVAQLLHLTIMNWKPLIGGKFRLSGKDGMN